jgi:hypothetical protein
MICINSSGVRWRRVTPVQSDEVGSIPFVNRPFVVRHVGQLFNEVATGGRTTEQFVLVVVVGGGGHHDNGGRQCATTLFALGQVGADIPVDVAATGHGKAIVGTFPLGMVLDDLQNAV